ncbi:27194af3-38f2-4680-a2ec-fa1ee2373c3b [Thermothielavioides terrestris]|nr:27194af3-38f2-4680-a2ec-fa1ee2373c3b [Thermothielavioides terrestris]
MAQQGRTRLPHKEDDSWTDHDSAIYMRSDSSSVESSSDTEGKFVVPLVQGEQLQEQREQATFLLNWQWKMDIARLDGRKYTWTETRLRNFQWSEEFYVDESGFLGVLAERANEQFRAAIADDPASYGAASCHWHKTKAPARLPRRKKTENEKEETPTVPKIVLTDPQGENWFLNDLRYYPDDFDEDDEEEEDESIYW